MKYIKVCKVWRYNLTDKERFVSYCRGYNAIDYKLNETTKPNSRCGPLAVFETIDQAIRFVLEDSGYISFYRFFECTITKTSSKSLWYYRFEEKRTRELQRLPTGTVLAASVTPTRQIEVAWNKDNSLMVDGEVFSTK